MRITQVRVGRTYNTLDYTSQRFEMEADIEEDENPEHALEDMAMLLHQAAVLTMRSMGIRRLQEPTGLVRLDPPKSDGEGDEDDIPF